MKHFALVLIMAIFLTASSSQYIRNKLPKGQTNLREDGGLHYEANDEYGIYYSKADRMHSQRGGSELGDASTGTVQIGVKGSGSSSRGNLNKIPGKNSFAYDDFSHHLDLQKVNENTESRSVPLLNPDFAQNKHRR